MKLNRARTHRSRKNPSEYISFNDHLATRYVHSRLWKQRCGPSGLHLFDRISGLNILLDEIEVPRELWSSSPRQVSIALTNKCDLACVHCYASKSYDELPYEDVIRWIMDLDANGCLGVGFGGGEPTLYPRFVELCQHAFQNTRLSVTFTTHGHHINNRMTDQLRGNVHFIRVSMDGVDETYEAIRGRSFHAFKQQLKLIQSISPFGLNIVVNQRTLPDLDKAVAIAEAGGAYEILLLPQIPILWKPGIDDTSLQNLQEWVMQYQGPLRLSIGESYSAGFPTCDPLPEENGLRAYAHIDAKGVLKRTSFHSTGVQICSSGVMNALGILYEQT